MTDQTDLIASPRAEVIDAGDLAAATSGELRAGLARALVATADGLARAAAIYSELARRGEAPTELRSGLATWLPRIAGRQLAAEAVIAFAGQKMLLRMIGMPLDEQKRLAAGGTISVAMINDKDEIVGDDKPLGNLSAREVLLAFADHGEVRPLAAQIRTLTNTSRRRGHTRTRVKGSTSIATIRADKAAGLIVVGRSRVDPSDLASALSALGWSLMRKSEDI